jgi:hypothetical protein
LGLANRRDSIPRRLSPYLNPRFSAHRGREWDALSRGSNGSCRTPSRCRSFRAVRSGVAQHAQADACNPNFMFSKMSTPASRDYRLRFPNRVPTVSRRCHPVALASAGVCAVETARHRASDAPSRCAGRPLVPGTSGVRLESSRPPCGETERRPDSSAPCTDAPRVDGPSSELSPRSKPTHQRIGLCNPHDPRTHSALFVAPRLRNLAITPLDP